MRAVVQRVTHARVSVEEKCIAKIHHGFLVLVAVTHEDTQEDIDYMTSKIVQMRVFEDDDGKMNKNILEAEGSILLVSQFTLYGDIRKGRRPSFIQAARPEQAEEQYLILAEQIRNAGCNVEIGQFGADMQVELCNDGPVTLLLDSTKIF